MFVYEILNTGLIEQSKLSLTDISMHAKKNFQMILESKDFDIFL